MKLRPYQEEAIETVLRDIKQDRFVLVQAATGAGKSIVMSFLCKYLIEKYPTLRIAILAHRQILVNQNRDKLLAVWPEAKIGIACASTGEKVDTDWPITIGTIQTLIRKTKTTTPFDLLIIDEVHRIGAKNKKSNYRSFIEIMEKYSPDMRVIGFTATPFRLDHGYIFGKHCKDPESNYFDRLNFNISIKTLQPEFLCNYRAKEVIDIQDKLKNVKTTAGEYNLESLSQEMSKEYHIGSAVNAYKDYGEGRKSIIVFAVTIKHAERLEKAFVEAGYKAKSIHSEMPQAQRDMVLKMFEQEKINFIINVGVLTEGFDSPKTDCIIMCRPTLSPALYCQCIGRGLRIHPSKKDVLILDLANNCQTHGDPNNPIITIPKNGKKEKIIKPEQVLKACPKCKERISSRVLVCPLCGYEFPIKSIDCKPTLKDVKWGTPTEQLIKLVKIQDTYVSDFTSKKGNRMIKLSISAKSTEDQLPIQVNHFFDFDGEGSMFGQDKARRLWSKLVGTEYPSTVDEALQRSGELEMSLPNYLEIYQNGNFWNIKNWKPQIELKETYETATY